MKCLDTSRISKSRFNFGQGQRNYFGYKLVWLVVRTIYFLKCPDRSGQFSTKILGAGLVPTLSTYSSMAAPLSSDNVLILLQHEGNIILRSSSVFTLTLKENFILLYPVTTIPGSTILRRRSSFWNWFMHALKLWEKCLLFLSIISNNSWNNKKK